MQKIHLSAAVICLMLLAAGLTASASKGHVDELRFGTAVDAKGMVPGDAHTDKFVPNVTIHATMKVDEAVDGTQLMLSVFNRETDELLWSESQTVASGHVTPHFTIRAGELNPGKYTAKVKLGEDWVAEHEFGIEDK